MKEITSAKSHCNQLDKSDSLHLGFIVAVVFHLLVQFVLDKNA